MTRAPDCPQCATTQNAPDDVDRARPYFGRCSSCGVAWCADFVRFTSTVVPAFGDVIIDPSLHRDGEGRPVMGPESYAVEVRAAEDARFKKLREELAAIEPGDLGPDEHDEDEDAADELVGDLVAGRVERDPPPSDNRSAFRSWLLGRYARLHTVCQALEACDHDDRRGQLAGFRRHLENVRDELEEAERALYAPRTRLSNVIDE